MMEDNINDYMPSILNPRLVRRQTADPSITQNSIASRCSLSLKRNKQPTIWKDQIYKSLPNNKENSQNVQNFTGHSEKSTANKENGCNSKEFEDFESIGVSAIQDINTKNNISDSSTVRLSNNVLVSNVIHKETNEEYICSVTSANELIECDSRTESSRTVSYEFDKPVVNVSFGITNCKCVDVSTHHSSIKRIVVSHDNNDTTVDCKVIESSQLSVDTEMDENMHEAVLPSPPKKSAITVNLDIKKNKLSHDTAVNSKVLILNTDAIEKLSHVIVQPPNYKFVKRKILNPSKFRSSDNRKSCFRSSIQNGKTVCIDNLKYTTIDSHLNKTNVLNSCKISKSTIPSKTLNCNDNSASLVSDEVQDMSKILGAPETLKFDGGRSAKSRKDNASPRSVRVALSRRGNESSKQQDIKTCNSNAPRVPTPRGRDSVSSHSPKKTTDYIQFSLSSKPKSNRSSVVLKNIPHHKIVAGTHFAVDAFSYGEIPNVKHYFLTHFHSDHYSGLKKSFNKLLFCSKITADLCISRLGVNPKCMHLINPDETIRVEDIEVTALDANHCPGALMLVFTLPNGKTLLHCGDFRACPSMESYPIFWNKDIHTIYLDTTQRKVLPGHGEASRLFRVGIPREGPGVTSCGRAEFQSSISTVLPATCFSYAGFDT
ncbi:DNA cross-link repair 1A protein-like isoform X1 [Achroia grisella]|uniref:DNA cross-link repair 1A protein-like isoform X1 n=1 Tax=Achroia grisella TaxID=688607 RepID=UPI0027D32AB3|nr:DNA cross-link repair 1A protein-like isoform X1 [Achroia grisella]